MTELTIETPLPTRIDDRNRKHCCLQKELRVRMSVSPGER